jgi:hypothetical protein
MGPGFGLGWKNDRGRLRCAKSAVKRSFPTIILVLLCACGGARLRAAETALSALKVLPKEAAANVVAIHAFEGKPLPERWHIMTYDEAAENGVHEYVVADGEIIASRSVSQFAEELKADDVVGGEAVKFDADKAAKLAEKYTQANKVKAAFYNYELKRDGPRAAPLWHIGCFDENGESLGTVVVSASKGTVVAHDGLPILPGSEKTETKLTSRDVRRAEPVRPRMQQPPPDNRGLFDRIFGGPR